MQEIGADLAAIKLAEVKRAFDRLFNGTRLFDPGKCAVSGCDRTPAKQSRFCGCCLEDQELGRTVVYRGGGDLLPDCAEMERHRFEGAPVHEWHQARTR
jgi:hypothetical protein